MCCRSWRPPGGTRRHQADAIDVRPEVMAAFNGQLQHDMQGTAWVAGCTNWYKTADGRITNNWSGSVEDYKRRTACFDPNEYDMIQGCPVQAAD